MQQKKDESTQMLDLGLDDPRDPRLRVAPGSNLQATEVAFDLGSVQSSKGDMPNPQQSGSLDFSQNIPHSENKAFSPSMGPGSAFGDTNQNVPTIGYQNVFTDNVQFTKTKQTPAIVQIMGAVALVVMLLVAYEVYNTGDLSRIFHTASIGSWRGGLFGGIEGEDDNSSLDPGSSGNDGAGAISDTQANVTQDNKYSKDEASQDVSVGDQQSLANDGNIWNLIRNEMGGEVLPRGEPLSADQESSLKAGISHEFTYQRYKTVMELAELRAPASEELLRQALESRKFWIRMRALIALADLGDQITDDDVKQALGDAHSELRSRFFKRFEKGACSVGCFYVARAALKHLDAPGRRQALRVITREASDVRDVFLVAATFDSHPNVRQTAEEWLSTQSIDKSVWQDIKSKLGREDSQAQTHTQKQALNQTDNLDHIKHTDLKNEIDLPKQNGGSTTNGETLKAH